MTINFDEYHYGLDTDAKRHINRMLHDYDDRLSLRRIANTDPAFTPEKPYGVWEDGLHSNMTNWVFTLAETMIDERVIARIAANDMTKQGASERFAKWKALEMAQQASAHLKRIEEAEAKREEMIGMAKLHNRTSYRHRINGEDVIIGDEIRSPRTYIS